ncbi:MAG: carbon monoxide dehydrogenase subunit G [Deltaproteobacteria bacterium]|nr:carbon monoxide dehydrogenase subunit G [Deltaproteobacteria bacterium]
MKAVGKHLFNADRQLVWDALQDSAVLARIVPGFESLDQVAPGQFEGALKIKVGPVNGRFSGQVSLSDIDAPNGYTVALKGKGGPGFVEGTGQVQLVEQHNGAGAQTELSYDFDLKVGGRIAGVGQRLLDSASRVFTKEALDNLEKQINARAEAARTGGPLAEVAAPSQAAFAAAMVKGVAADVVPRRAWPLIIAALLGTAALITWLLIR